MPFGVTFKMPSFRRFWVFRMYGYSYHLIRPLLHIKYKALAYASLYIIIPNKALNKLFKRPKHYNVEQDILKLHQRFF